MRKYIFLTAVLLWITTSSHAKVVLPDYFTSNMVIQQNTDITFSGSANAGKELTFTASWNNKTYTTKVSADGRWSIVVHTPKAGAPYDIVIDDGETLTLKNVAIGEVWFCSGQSNMEFPVNGWAQVMNYKLELAAADHPYIRLFQVKKNISAKPLDNIENNLGGWQPCTAASVKNFSAVAYFYARELWNALHVPVGVIDATWGGTPVEAWTSYGALRGINEFTEQTDALMRSEFSSAKMSQEYQQEYDRWKALSINGDKGMFGGKPQWTGLNIWDDDWQTISLPGNWEGASIPELVDFDGVVWLRKTINIPEGMAGKALQLELGMIDDEDVTFFDGKKIASGSGYMTHRVYTIPADLATSGKHVITVRVFDTGGGGGISGENYELRISDGKENISLTGNWKYKIGLNFKTLPPIRMSPASSSYPTVLFNAMVYPFVNFPIQGVIWYQGEANVGRANQYATLFPTLIKDWRALWGRNFPFYFVQLAGFDDRADPQYPVGWAYLREAQTQALKLDNTGMAVAIDLGQKDNIHPTNKQEVARRLSLIALAKTYNKKVPYQSPMFYSLTLPKGSSTAKISLSDNNIEVKGTVLKGFTIAGKDNVFYPAEATVKNGYIEVSAPQVASPVAVRYDWADYPDGNLYGKNGLPAAPFSTQQTFLSE